MVEPVNDKKTKSKYCTACEENYYFSQLQWDKHFNSNKHINNEKKLMDDNDEKKIPNVDIKKQRDQMKKDLENGFWVYDMNGNKTTIINDPLGHRWTIKNALQKGWISLKSIVDHELLEGLEWTAPKQCLLRKSDKDLLDELDHEYPNMMNHLFVEKI